MNIRPGRGGAVQGIEAQCGTLNMRVAGTFSWRCSKGVCEHMCVHVLHKYEVLNIKSDERVAECLVS